MITAVDSNILLDIFLGDATFGEYSAQALEKSIAAGSVIACSIVWAETAAVFDSMQPFLSAMEKLNIIFSPCDQDSVFLCSKLWQKYRAQGGKRQKIITDFFIGAHAQQNADQLLTRDRGFYRNYFKVKVVQP